MPYSLWVSKYRCCECLLCLVVVVGGGGGPHCSLVSSSFFFFSLVCYHTMIQTFFILPVWHGCLLADTQTVHAKNLWLSITETIKCWSFSSVAKRAIVSLFVLANLGKLNHVLLWMLLNIIKVVKSDVKHLICSVLDIWR